jgi:hypothetical protein
MRWFHGTPSPFQRFDDSFIGRWDAVDQEGPGHYFTDQKDVALGYASKNGTRGHLLTCELPNRDFIVAQTHLPTKLIKEGIARAPNRDICLSNWDEDPVIAEKQAVMAVTRHVDGSKKNGIDTALSLWAEFYRGHPQDYVRFMAENGFNGIRKDGLLVVYNTPAIRIVESCDLGSRRTLEEDRETALTARRRVATLTASLAT